MAEAGGHDPHSLQSLRFSRPGQNQLLNQLPYLFVVGVENFEISTSWSQTKHSASELYSDILVPAGVEPEFKQPAEPYFLVGATGFEPARTFLSSGYEPGSFDHSLHTPIFFGCPYRSRTCNLSDQNRTFYQLN